MRQLRIRVLMMGLSASLFFLIADGTNEVVHAQAATNPAATTNVAPRASDATSAAPPEDTDPDSDER